MKNIIENHVAEFVAVLTPAIWWFAHYVYKVVKWETFSALMLICNVFLAWYLWYTIWSVLPEWVYKQPLLSIMWFCTYPILSSLEKHWPDFFTGLLLKIFGKWK